ncbi:MAG: hypothetical protein M3Y45_00910 [Actinomycetota bacterium]|nr:hypothetical protein [Actinomycetota bacterium]
MLGEIRHSPVLLAAVLILGVSAPAGASPPAKQPGPTTSAAARKPNPPRLKAAKFDLTFVARQTSRWSYDEHDHDLCSGGVLRNRGSGAQTMVVRIPKVRVTVARVPEMIVGDVVTRMWPRGSRKNFLAPYRVDVQVNRTATDSSEVVVPPARTCAEGGPDAREPEPDCGSRKLRGRLDLLPPFARRGPGLGIETQGPYMAGGFEDLVGGVYKQCQFRGPDGLRKTGTTVISARKLFGSKPRLVAGDSRQASSGTDGNISRTTTRWRMVLTRAGARK